MAMGLMGLKVGMTQVYDEQGKVAPVTVLQVGPCPVLQVRDQERDGYDALQLGFITKLRRKALAPSAAMFPPPSSRAAVKPEPLPAWCCLPSRIASRNATFRNFVSPSRPSRRSAP